MQNKTLGLYYTKPEKDIKISLETHTHVYLIKEFRRLYSKKYNNAVLWVGLWVFYSLLHISILSSFVQ